MLYFHSTLLTDCAAEEQRNSRNKLQETVKLKENTASVNSFHPPGSFLLLFDSIKLK